MSKYESVEHMCGTCDFMVNTTACVEEHVIFYSALSFPAKTMLGFQLIIILLGFPKNGV